MQAICCSRVTRRQTKMAKKQAYEIERRPITDQVSRVMASDISTRILRSSPTTARRRLPILFTTSANPRSWDVARRICGCATDDLFMTRWDSHCCGSTRSSRSAGWLRRLLTVGRRTAVDVRAMASSSVSSNQDRLLARFGRGYFGLVGLRGLGHNLQWTKA